MSDREKTIATGGIEVLYRPSMAPDHPEARYGGIDPQDKIFPAGTILREGARKLTCDIHFQRDVPFKLSDGTTLYTDILRPVGTEPMPAIVAWSPYGKNLGTPTLDYYPFRMGVPQRLVSELQKWEAPDPALWVAKGYAVINVDTRGAYTSEGDGRVWSSLEGEDGAEFIDWIGTQDWCTGKVGLSGNSWLAAAQWFIAAQRPKHLAAIAPWEGVMDVYRNAMCTGGIPDVGLVNWLLEINVGHARVEDVVAMLEKYPLINDYWETHIARAENIEIPAYVVSSWSNVLHTPGTFQAYQKLRGPKWLRVHDSMEWPDYYTPQYQEDLARFFDRYLKGVDNGWEATPQARLAVFSSGPDNVTWTDRPEAAFPVPRTRYVKHFLDAQTNSLVPENPATEAAATYPATDGKAVFTRTFERFEEWLGFSELVLHVSAKDARDMDIFVKVQLDDADGNPFYRFNLPVDVPEVAEHIAELEATRGTDLFNALGYDGPWGRLRASHRAVDEAASQPGQPHLSHRELQLLGDGEIVEVRIALPPTGMAFKPGETLKLTVSSKNLMPWPFDYVPMDSINGPGEHTIHTGGRYASYLLAPETQGT